jgi:phosphoribosylformimino-5-aminoimidazole carboxamide ribonucleotide (ProFAR) isomerase
VDTPSAETRTKRVRITVDLDPADYQALNRWVASAGVTLDQPVSRLSLAGAVRAMIRAAAADDVVAGVVLDLLRRDLEAPR